MSSRTNLARIAALEAEHVPATADLIAQAMDVDAAYRYLFPDTATRPGGLAELFARNLSLHRAHRCTYVGLDDAGRVTATVTMRPPRGIHISSATMIRHGLLPFALRHGTRAVQRLLWLKKTYDALERDLAAGRPHWYVHMMAVAPDVQGRGVGAVALKHVMKETVVQTPDKEAVLTTHSPRNVTFYRRAGFEVCWERTVRPPGSEPYPVWGMVYG